MLPSASATKPIPGRSAIPTLKEWNAVGEVAVKGSTALGCETKMVREWFRISCRGKNDSGGTPIRLAVQRGSRPGTFTQSSPGLISLITPFVPDTHFAALFSWTDKSHVLRLDWKKGGPKPHIIGIFEGAKSPLSAVTATCAGKRRADGHATRRSQPDGHPHEVRRGDLTTARNTGRNDPQSGSVCTERAETPRPEK